MGLNGILQPGPGLGLKALEGIFRNSHKGIQGILFCRGGEKRDDAAHGCRVIHHFEGKHLYCCSACGSEVQWIMFVEHFKKRAVFGVVFDFRDEFKFTFLGSDEVWVEGSWCRAIVHGHGSKDCRKDERRGSLKEFEGAVCENYGAEGCLSAVGKLLKG